MNQSDTDRADSSPSVEEVRAALAQKASAAQGTAPYPVAVAQPKQRRVSGALVAGVVALLALVLVGGLIFLRSAGQTDSGVAAGSTSLMPSSQTDTSSEPSLPSAAPVLGDGSSSELEHTQDSVGSSDGTGGADVSSSEDAESQAASSSQEPSSEKGQPEASSTPPSIDIANVDTLHAVNIFLSNFSEKGSLMNGYTYEGASNQLVGDFSASHTHINNPYNISYGPAYPTVISYETPDEIFLRYPRVFLKRDLPREEDGMRFEGTDYGSFEGHVDLHSNRVPTEPLGIAYATSSEDAGEGRSRITFDVYYGGTSYDVEDMSYYNCTLEELKSRLGVSQPIATGVAVVEPYEDGTIAPFLLWSYESTR